MSDDTTPQDEDSQQAAGDAMEPEVVGGQFRLYRTPAGFVRVDWNHGAELTGEDARELLQALASLANGCPTPVLIDGRQARSVTREARKAFASSTVPTRVAAYTESSPLSRVLANFYIDVSHPSVPTKMFTDLDDAQHWLLAPEEPTADAQAAS